MCATTRTVPAQRPAPLLPEPRPPSDGVPARELAGMIRDASARGIAARVEQLVRTGRLRHGARLPTVRSLATALHVGPTTVAEAWSQLRTRGLAVSRGRHGTFVVGDGASVGRRFFAIEPTTQVELDLASVLADVRLLPDTAPYLAQALAEVDLVCRPGRLHDFILDPLLDRHLQSTWPFKPEDYTAVTGARAAVALLAAMLLRPGDHVLVESVHAPPIMDILNESGAIAVPVECDDEGPRPEAVRAGLRLCPVLLIYQTRMASPRGHALSQQRAAELTHVFAATDAVVVVELDAMHELSPAPAASVGTHLPSRTVLVRSWNTSHGPQLRVGALGGARHVVGRVRARQHLIGAWPSVLNQRAVARMTDDVTAQAQVAAAAATYSSRRQRLVTALQDAGLRPAGVNGLAVWVQVDQAADAIAELTRRGIGIAAGTPFTDPTAGRRHVSIATTLPHDRQREIADVLVSTTIQQDR